MDRRTLLLCFASLALTGCDLERNKAVDYIAHLSNSADKIFRFGIHPYLNPLDMHKIYQPIINILEKNIKNIKFLLEASRDYADFERKLYNREFEFALPNPYQALRSISYGYDVLAKIVPDSDFRGIIVTRKDNNITNIKQLEGHSISFPAPTALAATMMPLLYLQENGIDVKKNIKMYFVGSQYSSILNAYSKSTLAAATWAPPWRAWCKNNPEKASEMVVIAKTKPLINNAIVARSDVQKEIVSEVVKLLLNLNHTEDGKKLLENGSFDGFMPSNKQEYEIVDVFMSRFKKEICDPSELSLIGKIA